MRKLDIAKDTAFNSAPNDMHVKNLKWAIRRIEQLEGALEHYKKIIIFQVWYGEDKYEQEMFHPRRLAMETLEKECE